VADLFDRASGAEAVMRDWNRLEQLGRDIEEGRKISYLAMLAKLQYACPDASSEEIIRMAKEAFAVSDYQQ
jgi:hypothetical protein